MARRISHHAGAEELLIRLAEAERDLWARGGVHGHQHRRDLLVASLAAGCTLHDLARVLATTPDDIRAWLPTS